MSRATAAAEQDPGRRLKVLLITPFGFQNMGIRLLSAVLREQGFQAPILFFKGWRNNDIRLPTEHEYRLLQGHVLEHTPDVIGIGFGTPYLALVREMTRRIRAVSEAHVVWGGVHPTIMPEDCIEHADSVCIGEGEGPLVDLARAIQQGQPVDGIQNLWVRRGSQIIKNDLRPLITDLDALPQDQFTGVEMASIDEGRAHPGNPNQDNVLYRVFASRGCPFRCSYCYNSQYREIFADCGHYHRRRSVENVLAELEAARASLPNLRRVRFDDDSFVHPRAWIEELAELYPQRIGLPFDILLNPMVAKEWTLRTLRDTGLVHVQVGIQSGSAAERAEHYHRDESSEQILALAHLLRDLGIQVTWDIILDNPLASAADHQGMLDLLLRLPRPFDLFLYSLVVFPRSEIAGKLLAAGLITNDQVEGRATKSFSQFRLSLDYPRAPAETHHASCVSLVSKSFVPRPLIRTLAHNAWLARHPSGVRLAAEAANVVKLGQVALRMLGRGELSMFKIKEYASFRRRLIQ